VLVLATAATSRAAADRVVRVRTNAAFERCASALVEGYERTHGVRVAVEVASPLSVEGADLVIGDDSELTRILEGGRADERTAVDLGEVPWVLVSGPNEPAPPGELSALKATSAPLLALGGVLGRDVRSRIPPSAGRVLTSTDPDVLRAAPRALVPLTLAGPGRRQSLDVPPLVAVAAVVNGSAHRQQAALLLQFLRRAETRRAFARCAGGPEPDASRFEVSGAARFATAVVDWWLPACSLARNRYSDPLDVLGRPDAANTGGKDQYRGMMSLGQAGFVIVDMGETINDGAGPDVRVYQTTSSEPVAVYGASSPNGPFLLLARQTCGVRTSGIFSNHCDFDLASAGLGSARYFKVEDGEIYPCLRGDTVSDGADMDAVEA
jgi:hypothetical protein